MPSSINVPGTTEVVIKHVWTFQRGIKAGERKQALGELSQVPDANSNAFTKLSPSRSWVKWITDRSSQLRAGTEALSPSISSACSV